MSDQKNRKDALERLFKKKAEQYDIQYDEDDWLELEERLDHVDRQYARRIRRRLVAAAIVLAISMLTYFTIQNQFQINKLSKQISSNQHSEQPQKTRKENSAAGIQNNLRPGSTGNLPSGETRHTEAADQTLARNQLSDSAKNKSVESQKNITEDSPIVKNYSLTTKTIPAVSLTPGLDGRYPAMSAIKPVETKPGSHALTTESHKESLALANNRDKFTSRRFTHTSLGLVMGPDLSTAGSIAHFYDPGYRLGLTLDYNFSPNWGITTGIIRTRTRYTAASGNYHPPRGWSSEAIPERTVGDCVLLDIPLTVKYRFLDFSRSDLYASAGISSYIMLNEKYRFTYNDNQSGMAQGWSGKTGTRHWLSNASFSIGYEFDIRKNWSLRAEPFIKIPLKEVGWGNVKLYSMGSIISLNYKLK